MKFCTECGKPVSAVAQAPPIPKQQPVYSAPVYQTPAQPAYAGNADAVIGTGGFIGMMLLFCVPVVGWIACIVMAFSAKNRNRKNFAKAMLVFLIIGLVLSAFVGLAASWAWEVIAENARGAMPRESLNIDSEEDDAEEPEPDNEPEEEPEEDPEENPGGEIVSEAEAVGASVENQVLVARYIGENAMFGAARQYVVMEYFNEDGTIDEMWGTSKMLFFYDDEASYDAGFAEASEGGAGYVKEENKAFLYFSTSGGISNGGDWVSFGELAELIDTKSQRNPEYSQYEIIW
jgi:hypothetical protein